MKRVINVPQCGAKLLELRSSMGETQSTIATGLQQLLKPHMPLGYTIQQADISRLEREDTAIDLPKLLAYAHYFHADIASLLKPAFQDFCRSDIHLQHFETAKQMDQYLYDLEQGGRILVYSRFPSDFFVTEQAHSRYQQIAQPSYSTTELYTLDAYLNFLFSPVTYYSIETKCLILQRYVDYFRQNLRRHLRFFTRANVPSLQYMPDLEILPQGKVLVLQAPLLQSSQCDAVFEIRNQEAYENALNFYQQLATLDSHIALLRIGLDTLKIIEQGSPTRDAIRFFYEEVNQRTFDCIDSVMENFSPEIQAMLKD